jgi:AAA domain (dynein-related subfamily)
MTVATEEITLKPSQVSNALEYCLNARQPVTLWGEPGIGKSQIVQQTARRLSLACQDVRAVLLDPVDLRGLPHVNGDGRAHWAIPEFLPRDGAGVLFLDELNRAPQLVQNACFQLVLDRKLGEYTLPDQWRVIAACNRESDGGGVTRMSSALSNRFTHINVIPDLDDWCKWAVGAGVEPVVIAFLRWKPELLHKFDRNTRAFPSPRSWSFVSGITSQKPNTAIELALVAGSVGHAAATEYMAFLRLYRSLPSIDAIMLNPTGAPVPTEASTLYAVSSALARRAEAANLGRVIQYLDRLPVEFNVMAIRDAVTRNVQLTIEPDFTKWAVKHCDVVF